MSVLNILNVNSLHGKAIALLADLTDGDGSAQKANSRLPPKLA